MQAEFILVWIELQSERSQFSINYYFGIHPRFKLFFENRLLRVTSQFPFLNPTYVQGMEKIPITFLLDGNGMFNMRIMLHFRLYFNLQYSQNVLPSLIEDEINTRFVFIALVSKFQSIFFVISQLFNCCQVEVLCLNI